MQKKKKKTKKRSSVQVEEKIETYTTPNCLYTSKPAKKKKARGEKQGNKADQ